MDVFSISAGLAPKAAGSGSVDHGEPPQVSARTVKDPAAGDAYAASSPALQVEGRVAQLRTDVSLALDVRPDLIGKFRALMAVGGLDTPGAAAQAAEGLIGS